MVLADEPGLVPGKMIVTLVPDPSCRWSVGRCATRTAAKRALGSLVPVRQLMFCQPGIREHIFGCLDRMFRDVPLTKDGRRPAMGQISRTPTGYTLRLTRDTKRPGRLARRESLPEWRAQPVTGI